VLDEVASSRLIVANDPGAASWFADMRVIPDVHPGLGPLAGIEAGLAAAGGRGVLVLAWDMPFVPAGLLHELARRGDRGGHAVVPMHGARTWREPLCAYYPADALTLCRRLLAEGERQAAALAATLPGTDFMGDVALEAYGDPAVMFTSVDTPEELAAVGGALP